VDEYAENIGPVVDSKISPEGSYVASLAHDYTLTLWNMFEQINEDDGCLKREQSKKRIERVNSQ